MGKYAVSYTGQHVKTKDQTDIRSAYVQFVRPIMPSKGPISMRIHEINLGRAWSTFRVDAFQGDESKLATSTIVTYVTRSTFNLLLLQGESLELLLPVLQTSPSPGSPWIPHGNYPLRLGLSTSVEWKCMMIPIGHATTRHSILMDSDGHTHLSKTTYRSSGRVASHLSNSGSRQAGIVYRLVQKTLQSDARWTNELIQFAADLNLPIQEISCHHTLV